MNYSERYYNNVRWFKDTMQQISDDYDAAVESIKGIEGSPRCKDIMSKATAQRDDMTRAARDKFGNAFREIVKGMRENVQSRHIVPPTQDQLATLQALQMRKSVSMDELKQAARTMAGCPLALSVLDEIAKDNGHPGSRFNTALTPEYINRKIDNLERGAYSMLRGDGPLLKRHPESLEDCITRWGSIPYLLADDGRTTSIDTDTVTAFCTAVDGSMADEVWP